MLPKYEEEALFAFFHFNNVPGSLEFLGHVGACPNLGLSPLDHLVLRTERHILIHLWEKPLHLLKAIYIL